MQDVFHAFLTYEENFTYKDVYDFTLNHVELPVFAVAAYLMVVFYGPPYLQSRPAFKLTKLLGFWNLLLSVFSIIGVTRTLPVLRDNLANHGFQYVSSLVKMLMKE